MPLDEAKWIVAFKERRKEIKRESSHFNLRDYCTLPNGIFYEKQHDIFTDPSRFIALDKGRRAGATKGAAGLLMLTAHENPEQVTFYATLDKGVGERIIWRHLEKINEEYRLNARFNAQKSHIYFPNNSVLYIFGMKDKREINKMRGEEVTLGVLDECQGVRNSIMEEVIDDILEAALIDRGGKLILIGTPNAACRGYFYDCCQSSSWKHYHLTMQDNPWIPFKRGMSVGEIIGEHLDRKQISEDDPTFQREWLGKWVKDEHSIIYKFKEDRNIYDELPDVSNWYYILGADIGWDDSDALVVWAFAHGVPNLYCVHSEENQHEDISSFAHRVRELEKRYGAFTKRVIDAGGLGKKITEELKQRHNIYFEPADKRRKHEFIKLKNADFNRGFIKAKRGTPVVEEWKINQWNTDFDPPKEDERFSNDMSDAALYGYREAKHYTYEPEKHKPKQGSKDWEKGMWDDVGKVDKIRAQEEWWE